MKRFGFFCGVVPFLATIGAAAPALATPLSASVTAETSTPYGWAEFCQRYAGECQEDGRGAMDLRATPANLRKLARVNALVNHNIAPVSDREHFGATEQWDYPSDNKGDCEDYALLKRHMLIEMGFPRSALLMTVVREANGEGHSVLTVKTDRGDYVLDNLGDGVKLWTATPYRFVKRQSQQNQNVWVSLGAPTAAPAYVSNKDGAAR